MKLADGPHEPSTSPLHDDQTESAFVSERFLFRVFCFTVRRVSVLSVLRMSSAVALPWAGLDTIVQTVNTVEAIWMKSPSEVEEEKYDEFYQFIAKAYDKPLAKVRALQKSGVVFVDFFSLPARVG